MLVKQKHEALFEHFSGSFSENYIFFARKWKWKNNLKRKWTIYVEIQNRENSNVTLIQLLECFLLLYENHELVYVVVLPPNVVLALKASVWRALSSILVTFLMATDYFSGKNGALRWNLFMGKQKHNNTKANFFLFFYFFTQLCSNRNRERNETNLWYNMSWGCKWCVWLDKQIIPNFFVL